MFPSHFDLISIGSSYEGRDIPAVRMGDRVKDRTRSAPRKTILITGGIHAREWISTSTVNYLIWAFTTGFGKEPLITKVLQHFDIVFIPVVNPDGYEYTWESDRLWRKSRQQTSMRFCRGLDLDHAFGYEWDSVKQKSDPCSESYGGDQPFQAVEASQLATWAKNEVNSGVQFIGLLDLHSYSQMILFPYSYTCSIDPPNRENLEELATGLAKAIRLASGESYGVGSSCEGAVARVFSASNSMPRIESGGGSAIDWFYRRLTPPDASQRAGLFTDLSA
jgi:extracellular matrix protein 14